MIPEIPVNRNWKFRECLNFSSSIPIIPIITYFRWKQNRMRLDHPDYIKLIIEIYKKKRANNDLPRSLAKLTPANIRRECLNVLKKRYHKKDEETLSDFFGPAENERQFLQLIQGTHINKFKPLANYLKKNTEKTEDRNVELLAWLIDFRHRPYSFGKDVLLSDEELSLIKNAGEKPTETLPDKAKEEPPVFLSPDPQKSPAKEKSKRAAIIFLFLIISTGGIYAIWQQKKDKQVNKENANTVCVYWSNDRYEQVPCNEEPKGRLILLMSAEKVKSFRRITREDTITEWSIGKVYYIKDNNTIKYYTEGGNYPEDITRVLKSLSRYIFEKYLRKKDISVRDSLPE